MSHSVRDLIAAARTVIREIGPAELLELQKFGCPIVDVREPEEFADGHLPGAVNIPRGLLEFEVDGHPAVSYQTAEALSHRQRPVVLYCLSGGRSALAAEALLRLGFVDPMSLADGILGWADAGHPVVSPPPALSTSVPASAQVTAAACAWNALDGSEPDRASMSHCRD
jgi:rhodanese-related sulfurtransferase